MCPRVPKDRGERMKRGGGGKSRALSEPDCDQKEKLIFLMKTESRLLFRATATCKEIEKQEHSSAVNLLLVSLPSNRQWDQISGRDNDERVENKGTCNACWQTVWLLWCTCA